VPKPDLQWFIADQVLFLCWCGLTPIRLRQRLAFSGRDPQRQNVPPARFASLRLRACQKSLDLFDFQAFQAIFVLCPVFRSPEVKCAFRRFMQRRL
jgi:hypothetical protein